MKYDLNVFDVYFAQQMIKRGNQITYIKCNRNELRRVIVCFDRNEKSLKDYQEIMDSLK